mmetsp:Transcript_11413/g.23144  ORF Transcript_11413/g.23144 Transcript_11413/m.23144 type:complete len:255 (+) Transcript_11413:2633-3397(+)
MTVVLLELEPLTVFSMKSDVALLNSPGEVAAAVDAIGASSSMIVVVANIFHYIIFGLAIPSGLIFCFFGYKLVRPAVFLAGALCGGFLGYSVLFTTTLTSSTGLWLPIVGAIVIGLFCGAIVLRVVKLGIFALGAAVGCILAVITRPLWVHWLPPAYPREALAYYLTAAVLAILCGTAALCIRDAILTGSTAAVGAFGTVFGVGSFVAGFPSAATWTTTKQFPTLHVVLLVTCWALLCLAGTVTQVLLARRDKN